MGSRASAYLLADSFQYLDVLEVGAFAFESRDFQKEWDVAKCRMPHEHSEAILSNEPVADVVVAIDA